MKVEELVKRLRGVDHMSVEDCFLQSPLFGRAADKLEELAAENERLLAERDALAAENERLKEDRARFPDKPDDIGRLIEAHIGNLKEGKKIAEALANRAFDRACRAEAALAKRDKEIADLTEKFETLKRAYDRERQRPIQILGSNTGGNDAK